MRDLYKNLVSAKVESINQKNIHNYKVSIFLKAIPSEIINALHPDLLDKLIYIKSTREKANFL